MSHNFGKNFCAVSISQFAMMLAMETKTLLAWLLKRYDLSPTSLARKLADSGKYEKPTSQPQISKFKLGTAVEPKRESLAPIADFFKIPIEAFYNAELAEQVKAQIEKSGKVQSAELRLDDVGVPNAGNQGGDRLTQALRIVAVYLSDADDLARDQAVHIFKKLCEHPGEIDALAERLARTLEPVKSQGKSKAACISTPANLYLIWANQSIPQKSECKVKLTIV